MLKIKQRIFWLCLSVFLFSNCQSKRSIDKTKNFNSHPLVKLRKEQVKNEQYPIGSFVGRRYFIPKTRFWGYLRMPRKAWAKAKLVIMNEKFVNSPDRIPEGQTKPLAYGYDHNYQYLIFGKFSGRKVYDPNGNIILPEFVPKKFELIDKKPGFLFKPNEVYNPEKLPKRN